MEGERVLDHQFDINGAGQRARFEFRGHAQIRAPVEGDDVLFHIPEVRHRSLLQGTCAPFDFFDIVETRTFDRQAPDRHLEDREHDDAAACVLLRNLHRHGLVTGTMVALLERRARKFDVLLGAIGAQIGVDGQIDFVARQVPHPDNAVFADVKGRRQRGHLQGSILPGNGAQRSRNR